MTAGEYKTKLSWLRIENEDFLSAIPGFLKNLPEPVNTISNVKQGRDNHPYVVLGYSGENGFEGNRAAVWFDDFELSQDGVAAITREFGQCAQV